MLICRDEYGNRILEGGNGLKVITPAELTLILSLALTLTLTLTLALTLTLTLTLTKVNTPAELAVELKNQHPDGGAAP